MNFHNELHRAKFDKTKKPKEETLLNAQLNLLIKSIGLSPHSFLTFLLDSSMHSLFKFSSSFVFPKIHKKLIASNQHQHSSLQSLYKRLDHYSNAKRKIEFEVCFSQVEYFLVAFLKNAKKLKIPNVFYQFGENSNGKIDPEKNIFLFFFENWLNHADQEKEKSPTHKEFFEKLSFFTVMILMGDFVFESGFELNAFHSGLAKMPSHSTLEFVEVYIRFTQKQFHDQFSQLSRQKFKAKGKDESPIIFTNYLMGLIGAWNPASHLCLFEAAHPWFIYIDYLKVSSSFPFLDSKLLYGEQVAPSLFESGLQVAQLTGDQAIEFAEYIKANIPIYIQVFSQFIFVCADFSAKLTTQDFAFLGDLLCTIFDGPRLISNPVCSDFLQFSTKDSF